MENYTVLRLLGKGNYGSVYLATHNASGTEVALKAVPVEGMTSDERDRAMREVALLSHLAHPCVVRAWDAFIQDQHLHMVMEYCSGGDLGTIIASARRSHEMFTEVEILDWTAQILLALAHVHARRVLHRDLKAGNVFLTHTNTVRLGDFGIAKVLQSTLDAAKTVIGKRCPLRTGSRRCRAHQLHFTFHAGTPYYLSPEVCRNLPYDEKSDVWSLGCLVYELCSLRHAFSSDNLLALVFKIVQEGHPPLPPSTPVSLMRLVDMLLCKDVAKRPRAEQVLRLPIMLTRLRAMARGPVPDLAQHCQRVLQYLQENPEPTSTPCSVPQPAVQDLADDVLTTVGLSAPQVQPMPLQRSTRIKAGLAEHAAHAVQVLSRPGSATAHEGVSAGAVIRGGTPDTITDKGGTRAGSNALLGAQDGAPGLQRQDSDEDDEDADDDIVPVVFPPQEASRLHVQSAEAAEVQAPSTSSAGHRRQATDLMSIEGKSSASEASVSLPASPPYAGGTASSPVSSRSSSAGSSRSAGGDGGDGGQRGRGVHISTVPAPSEGAHWRRPHAPIGQSLSTIASGNTAASTPMPLHVESSPETGGGMAGMGGGGAGSQSSGPKSGPLSGSAGRPPLQPYGRRRSVPGYQVVQQHSPPDVPGTNTRAVLAPTLMSGLQHVGVLASPPSIGIEYRQPLSESELTFTPLPSSEHRYGVGGTGRVGQEGAGQVGGGHDHGAVVQRQSSGGTSAWPVYKGFLHSESPPRKQSPAVGNSGSSSVQDGAGRPSAQPTSTRAAFMQRQHSESDLSAAERQYTLAGISSVRSEPGSYSSLGGPAPGADGHGHGTRDSAAVGGGGAMSAFGTSPFHYGYYPGGHPLPPAGSAPAAASRGHGVPAPVSLWSAGSHPPGQAIWSKEEGDWQADVSGTDLHVDNVWRQLPVGGFGNLFRFTSLPNPLLGSPSPTHTSQAFGSGTPSPSVRSEHQHATAAPAQPVILRASSAPSPSRPSWSSASSSVPTSRPDLEPPAHRVRRAAQAAQRPVGPRQSVGEDYEPQLYSSSAHPLDDVYPQPVPSSTAADDGTVAGVVHRSNKAGERKGLLASSAQHTRESHSSQGIASGGTKQRRSSAQSTCSAESQPSGEIGRVAWTFPRSDAGRPSLAGGRPGTTTQGRPVPRPLGSHSPPALQTQGLSPTDTEEEAVAAATTGSVYAPTASPPGTPDTGRPPVAVPPLPLLRASGTRKAASSLHATDARGPSTPVQLRTTRAGEVCSIDSGNTDALALVGASTSTGGIALESCPVTLIPPLAHLRHIHAKCKRLKPLTTAAAAVEGGGSGHSTSARGPVIAPPTTTAAFVHRGFAGGAAGTPSTGSGSGLLYPPSVGAASLSHGTTVKTTSSPSPYLEYGSTSGSGSGSGSRSAGGKSGLSMQQMTLEGGAQTNGAGLAAAGAAEVEGRRGFSSRKGGFVPTAPSLVHAAAALVDAGGPGGGTASVGQRTVGLVSTPRGMTVQGKRRSSGTASTSKPAGPAARRGDEATPSSPPPGLQRQEEQEGSKSTGTSKDTPPQSSPESLPELHLPALATPVGQPAGRLHPAVPRLSVPALPSPALARATSAAGPANASPSILDSIKNPTPDAPASHRPLAAPASHGWPSAASIGEAASASRIPRYHGHAQAPMSTGAVGWSSATPHSGAFSVATSMKGASSGGVHVPSATAAPPPARAAMTPQAASAGKSRWEEHEQGVYLAARSRLRSYGSGPHSAGGRPAGGRGKQAAKAEGTKAAQLRAQCRSELGPALFDKVYAFLHKRAIERGEAPRASTGATEGDVGGPRVHQVHARGMGDAQGDASAVAQSPSVGSGLASRHVKSAGTRRPEAGHVDVSAVSRRLYSAGSARMALGSVGDELGSRHLRSQLKALLGAGKESMLDSALRVQDLLSLDSSAPQ